MGSKPTVGDEVGATDPRSPVIHAIQVTGRPEFIVGSRVAHYEVLGFVGAGGMGEVYRARDLNLARTVAIKILRPGATERDRARLQREARAMAKLSHPNVVTVHEVLIESDDVLLIMEYVDGTSLRGWLAARPRSWREIASVFVRAGRALGAAHRAGLVHRDFKPDNVLIGNDGRVLVGDFGVAASLGDLVETQSSSGEMALSATVTGAFVGTPAYMAPEQHLRQPVDARADQYAFCVSLYEAFYGARPFPGSTVAELALAKTGGRVPEPPRRAGVPRRVQRLLVRGLAVDPTRRHPSMEVLCAALESDPRERLRRVAPIVGLAAAALAGVVALGHRRDLPPCASRGDELAGVWDDGRRQAVRAAFLATGRHIADETFARVARSLDDYASQWRAARTDACEATAVRHQQSPALLDLRMDCLERRRNKLRSLASILALADGRLVERAVSATGELPNLDDCSASKAAATTRPLPDDPVLRVRVQAVRPQVDVVVALYQAGRFKAGIEVSKAVASEALAVPDGELQTEALEVKTTFLCLREMTANCEASARQLTAIAADAKNDVVVARMWLRILRIVEITPGRESEVEPTRFAAEAALRRAGDPPKLRGLMLEQRATALVDHGRLAEAMAWVGAEIGVLATVPGGPQLYDGTAQNLLGVIATNRGHFDEGLAAFRRARAVWALRLGEDHPWVLGGDMNIALMLNEAGRRAEAASALEKISAAQARILEPDDADMALTLQSLGMVRHEQGREDEAGALAERAAALEERLHGFRRAELGASLKILGDVRVAQGQRPEAERLYERARLAATEGLGPDAPDVAPILAAEAIALSSDGRVAEARTDAEKAAAIAKGVYGPDSVNLIEPLLALGVVARAEGKPDEALAFDRRALDILEKTPSAAPWRSALALEAIGDDVARRSPSEALTSFEQALARAEMALAPDDPGLLPALLGVGESLDALGHPAEAVGPLERALVLSAAAQRPPGTLARLHFALARAFWDSGQLPTRSAPLARDARAGFVAAGAGADASQVDAWMRKRHL